MEGKTHFFEIFITHSTTISTLKVHSQRDRGASFDLDIAVVESSYGTGNWYEEQVSKEMEKSSCNKNNALNVHQTTNAIKYSTMYKLYLQSILYTVFHSTGLALVWVPGNF